MKNLLDKDGSTDWVLEVSDPELLRSNQSFPARRSCPAGQARAPEVAGSGCDGPRGLLSSHHRWHDSRRDHVSDTALNLALDGLDGTCWPIALVAGIVMHKDHKRHQVSLVRYAAFFNVTGSSKELLEDEVKPVAEAFKADRMLVLSTTDRKPSSSISTKALISWAGRSAALASDIPAWVLVQPFKKNVKDFLEKCRVVFREMRADAEAKVIWKLNPILRGWTRTTIALKSRHASSTMWITSCSRSNGVGRGSDTQRKAVIGLRTSTSRSEVTIAGCLPVMDWTTEAFGEGPHYTYVTRSRSGAIRR